MKPTVTELLKLLDKPALLKWANKIGLEGIVLEDYRKKSMQSGSSLHKQIENYLKFKTPLINPVNQNKCEEFFNDKEILYIEERIETDLFIGRADIIFKWKDQVYVCDFKSNQKSLYFENKLQLIAYKMGIQLKCDNLSIISIPDFYMIHLNIKDCKPYEEILKALSVIHTIKKDLNEY
jgi:ATP-dependent exoDNAse (exonuclease V) beta subunit